MTLPDGAAATGSFTGDGPIDAVFQAINAATGVAPTLSDFTIGAVTEGQDALGEVSVVLEVDGFTGAGQGVSTDIIDAAARAYVRALSVAVRARGGGRDRPAGDRGGLSWPEPGARRVGWPQTRVWRAAWYASSARPARRDSVRSYATEAVCEERRERRRPARPRSSARA